MNIDIFLRQCCQSITHPVESYSLSVKVHCMGEFDDNMYGYSRTGKGLEVGMFVHFGVAVTQKHNVSTLF